jgi:hypothetical protein
VMICVGLAMSSRGETWQFYLGQGLFMGFLGIGGMNAPFYVYVSRWLCAPKARIISGGGFHPESCRLIWKLTSGSVG